MKKHAKKRRTYGRTLEERQQNREESKVRVVGESKRKLMRAMLAQQETIKSVLAGSAQPLLPDGEGDAPAAEQPTKAKKPAAKKKTKDPYPDPVHLVAHLVEIMTDFPRIYEQADERVNELDHEVGDLHHAVELLNLPKKETYKLYQEIKRNRTERRQAKDFIQKSKPLYDWIRYHGSMTGALIELQKDTVRVCEAFARRTYTPRVRQDLKELFESRNESAPGVE